MSQDDPLERASHAALRLISYRPRSEAEVRQRLSPRFPGQAVELVIQWLKDRELLDDVEFSSFWCRSRSSHSPRSSRLLKHELASKGVSPEVISEALQDLDDAELAYQAALKSARKQRDEDFADFQRKMWGHLRRRGFGQALIRETIRRVWSETSDNLHRGAVSS